MGRKATSIDNQIELLSNRGLILDLPKEKIAEILRDIGYYRLGFYWHYFEIDDDHNFQEGVKVSDVVQLYYLDVDLRHILLKYLNRIEINFRTQLIYLVSNRYNDNPFWFSSKQVVENWFIDSLPGFYNQNFIKNNKAIKLHHDNYHNDIYAPAWKTLEFMSFGFNLKLYRALKNEGLKNEISLCYNVRKTWIFINHFKNIIFLRNICAHGGTLYDLVTPTGIAVIPGTKDIHIKNKHAFDGLLKVISFYLRKISESRDNDFLNEIKEVLQNEKLSNKIKEIIETKMVYTL